MIQSKKPGLPVPPALKADETGTFTHYSVTVRLPDIARRVINENILYYTTIAKIETLIKEIPNGSIRFLTDISAPDTSNWERYLAPQQGKNWLEIPWFLAEAYFYRRILEATGYFEAGSNKGIDPFAYQKIQGLNTAQNAIQTLSQNLEKWLETSSKHNKKQALTTLLLLDLWGNQADLSLWPANRETNISQPDMQQGYLLIDNVQSVINYLLALRDTAIRVDFLIDNAGFELINDLCLVDFLLSSFTAENIHLHLKAHPTFVSDATIQDVYQTIKFLRNSHSESAQNLSTRLQGHLDSGRLWLHAHYFWTSPGACWDMPAQLYKTFANSHLVISKGDANYRRLLGDCHWPYTTPVNNIVSYFPAPLVALRTLKSDIMTGLTSKRINILNEKDPNWLTNGEYGIVQFVPIG